MPIPEPTAKQVEAATALDVSLVDPPLSVARLAELVRELQQRVEALERGGKRR
jgi:hypothetical protein